MSFDPLLIESMGDVLLFREIDSFLDFCSLPVKLGEAYCSHVSCESALEL